MPGVHAWATAGVRTSASNTAKAIAPAETARGEARITVARLNPDPLALTANRFPEIVQLVFHYVVDRIAGGVHVVAHLLDDFVDGKAIDHLPTPVDRCSESTLRPRARPTRALDSSVTGPASTLETSPSRPLRSFETRQPGECGTPARVPHERSDRTATRRPASEQQGDSSADRGADQGRRQQVVLLLTILVQIRFWV